MFVRYLVNILEYSIMISNIMSKSLYLPDVPGIQFVSLGTLKPYLETISHKTNTGFRSNFQGVK